MLHAVDQDNPVVFHDLVDDAIVAASSRPESCQFSNERLSEPARIFRNRPQYRLERSVTYFLRESIEVPQTLSRDLDLEHVRTSEMITESESFALFCFRT